MVRVEKFFIQRQDQKAMSSNSIFPSFLSSAFTHASVDNGSAAGTNRGGRRGAKSFKTSGRVPSPLFLSRVSRPPAALTSQRRRSANSLNAPALKGFPILPLDGRPTG